MPACCEVALPVPLDRVFTYAVREGQLPQRGARVVVPFNREKLIGVVTAVGVPAPTEFEVRYLEAVLDDEPLLSEQLLSLAEWMAQYYLAPLGEVLRGMLPLMAEVRRTVYYRITDLGRDVLADSVERALPQSLRQPPEEHASGAEAPFDASRVGGRAKALPYQGGESESHVSKSRHGAPDAHVSKSRLGAPGDFAVHTPPMDGPPVTSRVCDRFIPKKVTA